jgi:tetratricopeptide (TPR) repeat protein
LLPVRPHIAGAPGAAAQEIWGPGDIEGHRGTDGRYYVLDYARTFPPEHPGPAQKPEKGSVFFRLLRPELVRTFQCPLSPDALVGWGKADPNQPIHNKEVLDATLFLRDVVIPPIARELDGETERLGRLELEVVEKFTHTLGSRLHTNGINLRYLGLIRQHAANKSFRAMSLTEMIARVFKSRLNEKLRSAIASDSGIAIEKCLRYAVDSINLIISKNYTDPKVTKFWCSKIKYFLLSKFEKGLLPEELDAEYDLRGSLVDTAFLRFRKVIMNRFCTLCGISLSDDAAHYLSSLRDDDENIVLVPGDVVGFRPKIKNMVLGDFSYASSKFLAGLHVLQSNANVVVADRLFAMASAALKQSPRCAGIFFSRILDSESVKRQLEDLSSRDIRSKFLGEVLQVAAMLSLTVKQGLSPEESKLAQVDDLAAAAKLLRKRNYIQPAQAIISRAASMGVSTASFAIEQFRLTNNFTYADGLGLLQEALKLDPENIRARYYILLSHCYVPSRDYPQFIGDLAEVIKKRPEWLCRKHLLNAISSLPSRLTQFLALGEPDRWKHLANGEELNYLFIRCAAAALGKLTSMSFTSYCPPSVLSRYVEHLSDGNMNLESLLFDECGLDAPLLQSILLKICQGCSTLRFVHSPTVWVSFEHLKTMTNLKHLYLIGATLEPNLSLLDLASLSPSVEGLFLDALRSDWQPDDICQLVKSLPNLRGLGLPLWTEDLENKEEHAELRSSLFASIQSSKEHFANITYLSIRSYKSVWPEVASSLQSLVSDLPALQILDLRNSSIGAYHKSIVGLVHPNLVAVIDRDANCLVFTGNRNSEFVIERQSSMVGGRSGSYIWKATLFETESERLCSALEKCGQGDIPLWNFRNRRSFDLVTSPLSFKDKVFLQDYSQFYMLNVDKTEKKPTVSAAGSIDLHWVRSEPIFSLAPGAGASGGRFTIGNATVVLSASISRVEVVLANKTLGVLQSHATSVLFRGSLGPNICLTAYALGIIAYLNRVRG